MIRRCFFIIEMKNISFKVDKELHKAIKIRATEQYMDIKEEIENGHRKTNN